MSPGTLSLEGWRWESFFTSVSPCLPCSNEIKMVNFTPFMWSFTPHPVSCAREAQTSRRPPFKATLEWTTQNVCARLTSDAIKYSKSLLSWFFALAVFEWSDGKQRFELSMRETAQKTMKDKFAGNDDAIPLAKQRIRVNGHSMDQILKNNRWSIVVYDNFLKRNVETGTN